MAALSIRAGLDNDTRARLFADRTYKAAGGLPALYVQQHAFRDLYTYLQRVSEV